MLNQIVEVPTRGSNALGIVFIADKSIVLAVSANNSLGGSDHKINCSLSIEVPFT